MQQQFTDDLGNKINVSFPPKKIVSLVPSQTELLFHLDLKNEIAGITKFCIHPEKEIKRIKKIGGTKTVNIEAVKALNPDLIIANKEENDQSQIETLQKDFPVWVSNIVNLDDALLMIESLGNITNTKNEAIVLKTQITEAFDKLHPFRKSNNKVAYLIWRKPYMSINHNTFIHDMLKCCGFENVFALMPERYPEISVEMLQKAKPDFIFLSSEPYPFSEKHQVELLELQVVANANQIKLVDGEMFSWYGSRLLHAANYFQKIITTL